MPQNVEQILKHYGLSALLAIVSVSFVFAGLPVSPTAAADPVVGDPDRPDPVMARRLKPPTFPANPLISPTNGLSVPTLAPTFDWADATTMVGGPISYTLLITGDGTSTVWGQSITASVVTTQSMYTPSLSLSNGPYTWTVRAEDGDGLSDYVAPATFVISATTSQIYIPLVLRNTLQTVCPITSANTFNLIPIEGSPADRPGPLHADLNLDLRNYGETSAFLGLVDIDGATDSNSPQLAGLFKPNRRPAFTRVFQVNNWDWAQGPHGAQGPPITNPAVTMLEMATAPNEALHLPTRGPDIFGGGFKAMVLYAEAQRLTLGYTRRDTVAPGYTIHLEGLCVDSNLLALYQAQVDGTGWHVTGNLPGLRQDQMLGTALNATVQVVVRDRGTFLDPRSRKDWWRGY